MNISARWWFITAALALALASGCQKSSVRIVEDPGPADRPYCREFSTTTLPETHCLVPYSALIANAQGYDGMKIYTYAYLQISARGLYGLSAEREFRAQPDFASCVYIDPISVTLPESGIHVYSAAIAGVFEFSPTGHCLGRIRKPIIDAMDLETQSAS